MRTAAPGIKTPSRSQNSGGGISSAPPGHQPTRRAYQRGGVSIAALLMARAIATQTVLHGSLAASHSLLSSNDVFAATWLSSRAT